MHNRRAGRFLVGLALTALAMYPVLACGVATADAGDRVCRAGMIVTQLENWSYRGTSDEFSVDSDGNGRFLSLHGWRTSERQERNGVTAVNTISPPTLRVARVGGSYWSATLL